MAFEVWLAFAAASVVVLLAPGPTVLLVLTYALNHGRRVALAMAAGVALGDLVAMTASLLGLGALVLASATLFTALKWVGAAYLVWLGVAMLRAAPAAAPLAQDAPETADAKRISLRRVFGHAAAVTALNPKSIAFFIAFVPQFVAPGAPLFPQFAVLVATFVGLAALNALAVALLADRLRARLARPAIPRALGRLGGWSLIAMGAATAVARRAAP